jgi:hypothetical protein
MDGDPSIRYQTSRDILDSSKEDIRHHQMYIELEGWGKQILDLQDESGVWKNGFILPRYSSTLWVLTLLRRMGLERDNIQAKLGATLLLEKGLQSDGGIGFGVDSVSKVCISGLTLAADSYFRVINKKIDSIFEYLIESQMDDGGWHCNWKNGAKNSSLSTTLIVLDALKEYSRVNKKNISIIQDLQNQASKFMLSIFLMYSENDEIVDEYLDFYHPEHDSYDILSALDYFQSMSFSYDSRFSQAISTLNKKNKEGYWYIDRTIVNEDFITLEKTDQPSRWITLKAIRVLQWWNKVSKYKFTDA